MTTEYLLEQAILGPRLQMSITEERYQELANARKLLSDALAFEQRYELLLGNFISMELALTEICLRAKLEPQHGYSDFAEVLEKSNRHIVNLLTAMRGYADQVLQDFKSLLPELHFHSIAKEELGKVFDRSAAYRFIYALRNHVQHKATAIHSLESDSLGVGEAHSWAETVKFFALKSLLSKDPDFKRKVLDEQPERIDVRRHARRSAYELGAAHLALRKNVEEHLALARSKVEAAIHEYKEAGAQSTIGLCARVAGDPKADVSLLLQWDDVRLGLVAKNAAAPGLSPRRSHKEPNPEEIVALRERAHLTIEEAAKAISVSPERWQDYEDGLSMPQGLFLLYQLQVDVHPTHCIQLLGLRAEQGQDQQQENPSNVTGSE